MKKLNKKGFTITELVIVIAVIAILAAVLIPTFATIINKANASNALSTAKNAYTAVIANDEDKDASISVGGVDVIDAYIVVDGKYYFSVNEGKLEALKPNEIPDAESLKDDKVVAPTEAYYLKVTYGDIPGNASVYLYTAAE